MKTAPSILVATVGLLAACEPDLNFDFDLDIRDATYGEKGVVAFGYAEGCRLVLLDENGCELTDPVLVGGVAVIRAWSIGDPPAPLTASSTDESVLRIEPSPDPDPAPSAASDELRYSATGVAPGVATIELRDGDIVVDRVSVEVAAAAQLAFTIEEVRKLELVGSQASLTAEATDGAGRRLHGRGAIEITASDELARVISYLDQVDDYFDGTDHAVFRALEAGSAEVTATLGELVASETIEIVGTDAIVAVDGEPDLSAKAGEQRALSFTAKDAEGRTIYGAHCDWTIDAPMPTTLELELEDELALRLIPGADVGIVSADEPGVAAVTCAIGGAAATTQVSFE